MNAAASNRRQNAHRVSSAYGHRLHTLTRRKRLRDVLKGVSGIVQIEIAIVLFVGSLLFIH